VSSGSDIPIYQSAGGGGLILQRTSQPEHEGHVYERIGTFNCAYSDEDKVLEFFSRRRVVPEPSSELAGEESHIPFLVLQFGARAMMMMTHGKEFEEKSIIIV
jgi:hypothetical protein